MKTISCFLLVLVATACLHGCDKSKPEIESPASAVKTPSANPGAAEEEKESEGQYIETGTQTTLAPITMTPFTVDSLHIGELAKGHFNLYIKGGEPAIVRAWIGDEAATDAFIAKAEFEVDHHCAHIEVPTPLPADAKLWVEIETADGTSLKGSTEVQ